MPIALDHAILLEDALDMHARGMTKEQFVGCVLPCAKEANAQAWDESQALIHQFGTRRKAMNHVAREIERARDEFFPA